MGLDRSLSDCRYSRLREAAFDSYRQIVSEDKNSSRLQVKNITGDREPIIVTTVAGVP